MRGKMVKLESRTDAGTARTGSVLLLIRSGISVGEQASPR